MDYSTSCMSVLSKNESKNDGVNSEVGKHQQFEPVPMRYARSHKERRPWVISINRLGRANRVEVHAIYSGEGIIDVSSPSEQVMAYIVAELRKRLRPHFIWKNAPASTNTASTSASTAAATAATVPVRDPDPDPDPDPVFTANFLAELNTMSSWRSALNDMKEEGITATYSTTSTSSLSALD